MTDHAQILQVLADGGIHSGEELSALLGVSRTAIWKQLKRLQDATGLKVESIKGRGYCLQGGIELLNEARVISSMSSTAKQLLAELSLLGRTDSTNSIALLRAQQGAASGHVVVAEQQSAGRGRRGRQWVSPYGCNIYCSTIWQFQGGVSALEGLSLAVGVAVARALVASGLSGVKLKWPNDVLWDGRKLAGILLEMSGDATGHCQVIVGVGINVSMQAEAIGAAIDQPWTSVNAAAGGAISRNLLLANLLSELLPLLATFEAEGFAALREEWSELDAMLGADVLLYAGDQVIAGRAAGVATNGALAIETPTGCQWFHGGEVSLRLRDASAV